MTAAITGIGTAARVPEGEPAAVSFVVVATGAREGTEIVPGLEIEDPLGGRKFLDFRPGKRLPSRNHITDWTITIYIQPAVAGTYRARLYLNNLQRSELAFKIAIGPPSETP